MREFNKNGGWVAFPDKVLLETPVMTVRSGPVQSGRNGKTKDFYLLDFPAWVNVVALTPEGSIVMIRQYRYGSDRLELEIPGGMIEPGEDPVAAGCRELLEETGYRGDHARVIGKVCPNPAIQRNYCYTVLVENVRQVGRPDFDEMEDIECLLMSERELFRQVADGGIEHGLVLNGLMFFRQYREGRLADSR